MNIEFDELIMKIADNYRSTSYSAYVCQAVTEHFRSMQYLSSILLAKCILANIAINREITPTSADKIITCVRRDCRSMHSTVNSAFFPISDYFEEYAKGVLGEKYEMIKASKMRTTNYIVYVISLDLVNSVPLDPFSIFNNILTNQEMEKWIPLLYEGVT